MDKKGYLLREEYVKIPPMCPLDIMEILIVLQTCDDTIQDSCPSQTNI